MAYAQMIGKSHGHVIDAVIVELGVAIGDVALAADSVKNRTVEIAQ